MSVQNLKNKIIGVIGLGYVGLPLAHAFAKHFDVVGFDVDQSRIEELSAGKDKTGELTANQLREVSDLLLTWDPEDLKVCNVFIVTVPTPISELNVPDLTFLQAACRLVGRSISSEDTVIFESTVYPGATEEECIPILEEVSGMQWVKSDQQDLGENRFFVGYSPERINPGDKSRTIEKILKVVAGDVQSTAKFMEALYSKIVREGVYVASSIKVAEAAKVIENTQRDLNIALVNELAIICHKLGIDTKAVLEAAETKWNFMRFSPGLVGGHCIGVDPYYLTHKAEKIGHSAEVILAGRKLNDGMGKYVATQLISQMKVKNSNLSSVRVLVCGLTFKEDCPDIRNSKVFDLYKHLSSEGCTVDLWDPIIERKSLSKEIRARLITEPKQKTYHCIILSVPHALLVSRGSAYFRSLGKDDHLFCDLKSVFSDIESDWRL